MNLSIFDLLKKNQEIYDNYPEQLKVLRENFLKELKEILNIQQNKPLIVNGHQVEFFHPGILSKEILAHDISKKINGHAISIVLDHDLREINFKYPYIYKNNGQNRIKKHLFTLVSANNFYKTPDLKTKSTFLNLIKDIQNNLSRDYPQEVYNSLTKNLDILKNNINKNNSYIDLIIQSRLESLKHYNIHISPVTITQIVKTKSWGKYCDLIIDNIKEFQNAYNEALHYYRKNHHIKNHAQPIPDLPDNELPFWIQDKSKNRFKAKLKDKKEILYPRAVTLSIFLRLFASDIFIHGTGGGRYDMVTNRIVWNFFKIIPSDFIVKTKTLHLPLEKISPFSDYYKMKSMNEWSLHYRKFIYHPELFISTDQPLIKERFKLIEDFKKAEGSKLKEHMMLEKNRETINEKLKELEVDILKEKEILLKYNIDKSAIVDRTYPYFFYDMNGLLNDNIFTTISCEMV